MEITEMTNRIDELFARKKSGILSVFYTAGFPKRDDTMRIAETLEHAGADMLEIGIPFSDPIADGPVIQHSNKVAIGNGITLSLIFNQVREVRKKVNLPVLLMGYLNPVIQYGIDRFVAACREAGADGVILPDLTPEEYVANYKNLFEDSSIKISFLITPNTPVERIRWLDELSNGFVYAVSASGTTGVRESFNEEQFRYFERVKALQLKNPFLIGFGVSNGATFAEACRYGAGAIIGSAFINMLEADKETIPSFINSIRGKSSSL
jgi:tryptophan synthase alpha chain